MTATAIAPASDIGAIDVHSHNVLPAFVRFLDDKGAALYDMLRNSALHLFGKTADEACQTPVRQVAKLPMQPDGIVRLSRVEVYPEYLDQYIVMAAEVGQTSLLTEPGVLTMYALAGKDDPNVITILETYASQEAYRSHIASAHFQKYKQGTLHMVKDLRLLDQTELNPANHVINFISDSPQ